MPCIRPCFLSQLSALKLNNFPSRSLPHLHERFSYIAIIEGGHRLLQNRFTQEELASGHDLVDDDEDEDEDMEEDDDDDDSDQSDSEEEDEASGFLVSANQREEDDEPEDLPDIAPPPPPKRVESLSPASERKYLLQVVEC